MKRFLAVLRARNIEFLRDRSALMWNILMPVLIIFAFAFLFTKGDEGFYKVGVIDKNKNSTEFVDFLALKHVQFVPVTEKNSGIEKIEHHQLDMLVDIGNRPHRRQVGDGEDRREEPFLTVQVQLWLRELRHLLRKVQAETAPPEFKRRLEPLVDDWSTQSIVVDAPEQARVTEVIA